MLDKPGGCGPLLVGVVLAVQLVSATSGQSPEKARAQLDVAYETHMLVVTGKSGAAAIVFHNPTQNLVSYRYRYLSHVAGKVDAGSGTVREAYRKVGSTPKGDRVAPTKEHHPYIHAGKFTLEWSKRTATSGNIVWDPKSARVSRMAREKYAKLDLAKLLKESTAH